MKISVVIATYNGAAYVEEQLESILNQNRKVDEVLIADDCSEDNTTEIVDSFIKRYALDNWYLIKNTKNVGWKKNFINIFYKAKGDIIFLADQDDVWEPRKVEVMTDIFEKNSQIAVLASNIDVVYEDVFVKRNGYQIKKYGTGYLEKVNFDKMWLEPWRPGCSMAFKRQLLPYVEKVWFEECAHDLSLWAIGIARGEAYIVNEKLVCYRRHKAGATPSNKKTKKIRVGLMETYLQLAENILRNKEQLELSETVVQKAWALREFYFERKQAMEQRNILGLIFLLKHRSLYPKVLSWLADVISAFR